MSRVKKVYAYPIAALFTLLAPAYAQAIDPGHVNWHEWSFDYEFTNRSGLVLRNVKYKNFYFIYKVSLPVTRVQYDGNAAGPYQDRIGNDDDCSNDIHYGCLMKISNCDHKVLCVRSFTQGGTEWLQISIVAAIGDYRLNQKYLMSRDGTMDLRLYSRGVANPTDHRHHPYWRIDFDINGKTANEVWAFEDDGIPVKYGCCWLTFPAAPPTKLSAEGNFVIPDPTSFGARTNRRWLVKDPTTNTGVWVIPPVQPWAASGRDSFSSLDVALRRYKSSEDTHWVFGASGELGYNEGETLDDVVFWYVGHMYHDITGSSEDAIHWVGSGARLKVNAPPVVKITSPANGTVIGAGGFNFVSLNYTVTDVEDGDRCCEVTATSNLEGDLITGSPMVLTTVGQHVITVTARDLVGATGSDSITIMVGNQPPTMTIKEPDIGEKVYRTLPFRLEGLGADTNEAGFWLPCTNLRWTSTVATDPFPRTGCQPLVTFMTNGLRMITLKGTDSGGLTATATRWVNVEDPPATGPPQVSIITPQNNHWVASYTTSVQIQGQATSPSGGPLTYQWTVTPHLPSSKVVGTALTGSWKPEGHVPHHCGGMDYNLCLTATDATGLKGSACVTGHAFEPVC